MYYVRNQKIEKLLDKIHNTYWWETIRLYCAQSDGTNIIEACLAEKPVTLPLLQLGIYCLEEALRVDLEVRQNLNHLIAEGVEDTKAEWRNTLANALLLQRLRFMQRIDSRRLIDSNLVTNVEYQVFLDQKAKSGQFFYPDHWVGRRFKPGKAMLPIVGVRSEDAKEFCQWLVPQDIWRFHYRIPDNTEIHTYKCDIQDDVQYWVQHEIPKVTGATKDINTKYKEFVTEQILEDSELFSSIRSALYREKNVRPTSSITFSPVGNPARTSYEITSEIRARQLQKDEMQRAREHYWLVKFREYAKKLNFDFDSFLDTINVVNVKNKEHLQSFDWLPLFLIPPEYGFDFGKEQLEFNYKYSRAALLDISPKRAEEVINVQIKASEVLLNRSWPTFLKEDEDPREFLLFVRAISRISLLALAFLGKKNQPALCKDIADLYLIYCLLERRIAGKEPVIEGIRLLKYS